MSETFFPVSDLLRRKSQTSLTVISLTCSVASTLFLLSFSYRMGLGFASGAEETLTIGLSAVFSQLILFVGVLIFVVGAVLTSFIVFLTMKQRTRDFGLIKAVGCPNNLVFGYFMTELLILALVGGMVGLLLGFGADFTVSHLTALPVYQKPFNMWLALLVFVVFFLFALVFGTKPILDAARLTPMEALSSVQYYSLATESRFKPFSASWMMGKIAVRSLSRRSTATLRIILLLSVVFMLLTVSISGSLIAKDTTLSWVERTAGRNVVAIGTNEMVNQYGRLQEEFVGIAGNNGTFDYFSEKYIVSDETIRQLRALQNVVKVDARLILKGHVYEISNFTIDPETLATIPVGDKREADSILIGVESSNLTSSWFLQGRFLENDGSLEAVVGDSVARKIFSKPLVQSLRIDNQSFAVVGVCVDPVNNGNVIYVPMKRLQQITAISGPNIVFIEINSTSDRAAVLDQIRGQIEGVKQDLTLIEADLILENSYAFLNSAWSIITFLPLFTLASASICLIGYVMLNVDEQRQEFMILRAVGAKPKTIVTIVGIQNSLVMASSLAFGLSFGIIATLLILVSKPVVSGFTILQIALWLTLAASVMFVLSLAPAMKFARTSLLKIMA